MAAQVYSSNSVYLYRSEDSKHPSWNTTETLPSETVTPKLHMLEKHVVQWLRHWEVGPGLMGKQSAESIHHWFNGQRATFHTMHDDAEKVKATYHV